MNTHDEPHPPLHGYRGSDSGRMPQGSPQGHTIAVSREAGSRGLSIAERLAQQLGWDVYDQDVLNYLKSDDVQRLFKELGESAQSWVDFHFEQAVATCYLEVDSEMGRVVRLLLVLAGKGNCVLIGRGAGLLLPQETTLRVRIVAPLQERIAYLAESLRMTHAEAEAELHSRDSRRAKFLQQVLPAVEPTMTPYDMVLNSKTLGQDACTEIITHAVRLRQVDEE